MFFRKNEHEKEKTAYYCGLNGGDGGSRTRVRKSIAKAFSERSLYFNIPLTGRPQTGFPLWYSVIHGRATEIPRLTFTANRRSYPDRGASGKNGCLIKQQEQLYCCRLLFKFAVL